MSTRGSDDLRLGGAEPVPTSNPSGTARVSDTPDHEQAERIIERAKRQFVEQREDGPVINYQGVADGVLALAARLAQAEQRIENQRAANEKLQRKYETAKGDYSKRLAEAERALTMVQRIARNGVGPDTTPEQALATIAEYVTKRLAAPDSEEADA